MLYDAHGRKLRRVAAFGFQPAPDVWVIAPADSAEADADAIAHTEIEDPEEEFIQCHLLAKASSTPRSV